MRPPPTHTTTSSIATTQLSMSCRAMPTHPVINTPTPQQYNSLISQLDSEMQQRAQLEADLVAARHEIAHLKSQLALHSNQTIPSHTSVPTQLYPPAQPPVQQPTNNHRNETTKSHEKEILSHCSDISASKVIMRDASIKKSHRKSSNLASLSGVTKKGKSKKERAAKIKIPGQSRYWTPEEHKLFLEALNRYGHKDLRAISAHVGTRNMTQVRTHSQKYFMRLMREAKRQNPVAKRAEENKPEEPVNTAAPRPEAQVTKATTEGTTVSKDEGDKYSVPNTCGMTLLCLVGQDTLPV